jgi:hypothetical protein
MLYLKSDPIFLMTKASCLPKTNRPLRNGEGQSVKRGLSLFEFSVCDRKATGSMANDHRGCRPIQSGGLARHH